MQAHWVLAVRMQAILEPEHSALECSGTANCKRVPLGPAVYTPADWSTVSCRPVLMVQAEQAYWDRAIYRLLV